MKIVINISKELYTRYKEKDHIKRCDIDEFEKALDRCIILPKGHGRLIDEKDVIENICETHGCYEDRYNNCKSKSDNFCGAWDVVENAPTIIEADISGKEKE